jgi:NADP-reducing hydrogenase subunit HndB
VKLKPEDLDKIRERMKTTSSLREGAGRARVNVHLGTCGIASGAREILKAFLEAKKEAAAQDVLITTSGCAGLCNKEPMATIELMGEAPVKYIELTPEKVRRIFKEHVLGGRAVGEFALAKGSERMS